MEGTPTPGLNRIKELLRIGAPSFGIFATIPGVQVVQILASAGFDWVLIDQEHAPNDMASVHAMIVATAGTEMVPFVRIPWTHPWQAKTVMDLGALGVCFPMVCNGDQACNAVRCVRYPPDGDRFWGPFYAPMRWSRSMSDYIEQARTDVLCIGTIEHPTAVQNIDEIAATPGLDIAFIGPGDLAMNLGIPGQFDHSKFKEAVARAEAGLLRSGVALGGVARTADQAKQMLDRGYRVLVLGGFDWMLLQQAGRTLLDEVRC
jgi:4-hydroxy-2-oxoheptanedioate aldolase